MKTLKNVLLLVVVTIFLASCGGETTDTNTENSTVPGTETTAGTEETSSANTAETADVSGKITDAIVDKACACVNKAKEGGATDLGAIIPKIQECMGGNSETFVKGLLSADASDKQVTDALKSLKARMAEKCPLQ